MKTLLFSLTFLVFSYYSSCQNSDILRITIQGYNLNDTIPFEEFLKIGKLTINENDYSVNSFILTFNDEEYDNSAKSHSHTITDTMKNALKKLNGGETKIIKLIFEGIQIKDKKGTIINVTDFFYYIKFKE